MVSLRGRSFGSLQRRISHPASHTSPAAKTSNACDPCAILTLPRARVRLHHTSSAPPIQLAGTLRSSGSACKHVAAFGLPLRLTPSLVSTLPAIACQMAPPGALSALWGGECRVWCGGKHGRLGLNCWRFAPVAQGIEQRFPKPRVGGSNPSRRATKSPANSEKTREPRFCTGLDYTNYYTNVGNLSSYFAIHEGS